MYISIFGFSKDTSEEDIRQALEAFGAKVKKVTIEPSEREQGQQALVDVDTDEAGCKALAEHIDGHVWNGRKLRARTYVFLK